MADFAYRGRVAGPRRRQPRDGRKDRRPPRRHGWLRYRIAGQGLLAWRVQLDEARRRNIVDGDVR
jgi:hypothetical protein